MHSKADPFSLEKKQLFRLLRDSNAVVNSYKDNGVVNEKVSFYADQALFEQGETIDVEKLKKEYFKVDQYIYKRPEPLFELVGIVQ